MEVKLTPHVCLGFWLGRGIATALRSVCFWSLLVSDINNYLVMIRCAFVVNGVCVVDEGSIIAEDEIEGVTELVGGALDLLYKEVV